ncbi:MAG: acyl-CoA/acyl-ACP dehydrogenase [Chloroflexi bacterium]|nr:acyl-CoA/acyl-ACP dehydrogenase [Chloroflexota bacterium]
MDFEFSAEQRMLRDSIRSAYSRDILPIQRAYPQDRPLPKAAFAPLGFYGARVPLELGGSGLDHVSWGMFYEEFPPVLSTGLLACEATTTRLARGSSAVVRERFLPGLLDGRLIGASGTSGPNVGSDPRGVETRAVPAGDGHYAISGRKLWTSNGSICDVLMAVVRLESPGGASSWDFDPAARSTSSGSWGATRARSSSTTASCQPRTCWAVATTPRRCCKRPGWRSARRSG